MANTPFIPGLTLPHVFHPLSPTFQKWRSLSPQPVTSGLPFIVQCLHAWHEMVLPPAIIFCSAETQTQTRPKAHAFLASLSGCALSTDWTDNMKGFALVYLLVQSLTAVTCSQATLMGSDKDFLLAVQVVAEAGSAMECIQNPDRSIFQVTGIHPAHQLSRKSLFLYLFYIKCLNWVISNRTRVWLNYAKD